jgi:ABC-type glycerol-3-phosphate transport system substrate-binding protein
MINRYSPLREHALNYLKFMSGDAFNVLVNSQADGLAPVKRFAYTEDYLHNPAHPEEDQNEVWLRALEIANPDETCAFVNEAVANRIISEQLDLVRNNQKTAEAAVRSAAQQINAEIAKNLKKNKNLKARYDALRAEKKQP